MRHAIVALTAALLASSTSCGLFEPTRRLARIDEIVVPAAVAASDSLRFSFRYRINDCFDIVDGVTISAEPQTASEPPRIIVAVSLRDKRGVVNCGETLKEVTGPYAIDPALRRDPTVMVFLEPGDDSTRIVRWR